ncbi:UNVERIFIED_CONTAM: hypothetical protein NCL1_43856 [Trichonephila clavipes]
MDSIIQTNYLNYLRKLLEDALFWQSNMFHEPHVGKKDFTDNHREEITDFVHSIPRFQESDKEDAEIWMACDAEDCGFQMLNDDEIVTSVQEESDPFDDETDEVEYNNKRNIYQFSSEIKILI